MLCYIILNEVVKNNPLKFPERFSWKLTDEEISTLRSKILTTNYSNMSRSNPRVFTEQGIAMLATILKTKVATETSIAIMDAFVSIRHYIGNNLLEQKYINNMVLENNERINRNTSDIKLLQESFNKLEEAREVNEIYYNGKIYDAYSKIIDIFREAKKELIIVDRYTDKR